ncbi:O-antigen ligase family protein [Caminibacter mediatlanticus]|uniref:O-antigen ligase-related domain-containing protein n=1 Tax=Caminibacter mediatlanticus TB-2 TaxID=391592 RepID=A0AAI9AGP4_9BACT|nr:O-antigen ligase family protein [Caminibacter mediatlanticus]EDM23175.1 hypothetical protein CMTB2_04447 [Caminibacter mediatlanticus TB-2]
MKIKLNSIIILLIFMLFLTSSFDIFLNINLGGFHLRIVYIIEFLLFSLFLYNLKHSYFKFRIINWQLLLIWILFLVIFIPNTNFLIRNIGYVFWLFLSIIMIALLGTLINKKNFFKIFDYYVLSFYIVAIFGFVQFILGLFGISLLTTQWWIYGKLPRINGFNYEPSYFGTYLLIGWSLLFYLIAKDRIFKKRYYKKFLFITLVMILSSSRMTILFLIIIPLSFAIVRIFNDFLNRFSIKKHYVKYIILLLLIIYFLIFITVHYWDEIKFLYAGLGIGGTSAHSSGTRINQMLETFEVFLKSPLIGYSLGGIPSAIALSQGITINSQIEAKNFEGMNVFLEVLAASGIIGFLFFLLYLIFLFLKAFSISRKLKKTDYFLV